MGCLPCSVWPGHDNDLLLSGHTVTLLDGRLWLRLQYRPQALDLIVPPIAVKDPGGIEAKLAGVADALNYNVTKVATSRFLAIVVQRNRAYRADEPVTDILLIWL